MTYENHMSKKSFETDIDDLLFETSINGQDCDEDDDDDEGKTCQIECELRKDKRRSKARIIRVVGFNKEADLEKYRELIMLFTSWRNENTDLVDNCSSYLEHFFC